MPAALIPPVIILIFAIASYFINRTLMVWELIAAVVVFAIVAVSFLLLDRRIDSYFSTAAQFAGNSLSHTMADFALPIMITNKHGEITWYNERFRSDILHGNDIFANPESIFFDDDALAKLNDNTRARIDFNNRKYIIYAYNCGEESENQHMYFFIDDTRNVALAQKYRGSRPCMMLIHVDGLDILLKNALESQKTEIKGEIERRIEGVTEVSKGYLQKISSKNYLLVTDYDGYERMKSDKFSVLSKVRELQFGDRGGASLSIGVGLGDSLQESAEFANNALDMALGRGGDQAVIKKDNEFTFFGGVTQAAQVNSRVRTRVIAATLKKLIENSENVLIMGHSYSDMDSFGAAFGLCCAVRAMGKPSKIVIDEHKSLASPLIDYVKANLKEYDCSVTPLEILPHINHKTLLIIVDTHRPSVLESRAVFEKAQAVVVIDHHRQTVDCINDSLLFYHDPSSSSTCEMVTELLQYMGDNLVSKIQAEALLAGISLDTRNFVMNTSARTFEASGYLSSKGASPVRVRRLFADSLETYTARANIVANAEFYRRFAVSSCPPSCKNSRIASSEAADELLTIKNVDASFVMYKENNGVNISARSLGAANVQLIMEALGGGGHQTMAAVQLENCGFDQAKQKLAAAIDSYLSNG